VCGVCGAATAAGQAPPATAEATAPDATRTNADAVVSPSTTPNAPEDATDAKPSPATKHDDPGAQGGGAGAAVDAALASPVTTAVPVPAPAQTASEQTAAAAQADLAAEEAAIAEELAAMAALDATAGVRPSDTTVTARPTGNALNPSVSANGLLTAGGASEAPRRIGDLETGLHIQEVELRFSANVDPYLRADLTLAAHEGHLAFEEAYLTTLEIPHVNIRAGQMYAAIGRHNLLHTHAFPFVTAPHASRVLLGQEGARDPGVSLDVLLPLPFYVEFNAQVFRGEWAAMQGHGEEEAMADDMLDDHAHAEVADERKAHDLAYVGHLKVLLEAGDDATVELGGSYVGGRNGFGGRTDIVGGDLTVKWRPLAAERYTGFDWSSEVLWVQRQGADEDNRLGGAFSGLRYQFAQRFWVQARYGVLGLPEDDTPRSHRVEGLLAFIPSEFSGLRLQYAHETSEQPGAPDVHEVFLQTVFSIGPHPPHDY